MKTAWQACAAWTWAGSCSLVLVTATAVGQTLADPEPAITQTAADEPPAQAEKPAEAPAAAAPAATTAPEFQPVPDPAFGGLPPAANVVIPGMVVPAPAIGVAAPSVVGDYRVGHVHKSPLSRIFWYSAYNPYLDQLTAPMHARVHGTAHAPYYAGYRTIHTTSWSTYYVPQTQCYAPGAYGYTASPAQGQPQAAGTYNVQYGNGPSPAAPYGPASALYFGAYGPASY